MATRSELLKLVEAAASPGTKHSACPSCGGHNSLSITKTGGSIRFLCHRASCLFRGAIDAHHTQKDVQELFLASKKQGSVFVPPDSFVPFSTNERCTEIFVKYHCAGAILDGRVKVWYDAALHRAVFKLPDGAIGRKLSFDQKTPKWYKYGGAQMGFLCPCAGPTDNIIIVEDPFSACAVSEIAHGFALCGTHLSAALLDQLLHDREWNTAIIVLDPDAFSRALGLQRTLSAFVETKLVWPKDDLKYFTTPEINEILKEVL